MLRAIHVQFSILEFLCEFSFSTTTYVGTFRDDYVFSSFRNETVTTGDGDDYVDSGCGADVIDTGAATSFLPAVEETQ